MVFTKLSVQEKDAFFGLLDEYFQSRPELFGQSGGGQGASGLPGTGISAGAAASVFQRALTANATSPSGASGKSNHPITAPNNVDVAHAVNVGRVAATSLAFSGGGGSGGSSSGGPSPSPFSQLQANFLKPTTTTVGHGGDGPPPPPHRGTSSNNVPVSTRGVPGSEVDRLMTHKTSVFAAFKKPAGAPASVAIPSAFVAPKNTFAPPPMRRPVSETAVSTTTTVPRAGVVETRAVPPPPPPAEEVAQGHWAEVLYDYSSEDPGDLAIKAGTRVFVTDKTSEDWWTGQVEGQGREGLFPASYVNLL
ncbi:hypothetical protein HD554DRAFT_2064882 [Boletus coccyginus]|nr:hypothetical protein HD554DRAFT_2064882 [Boletus coccyginus]